MQSDNIWKGLAYGGFASCVAETSAPPSHTPPSRTAAPRAPLCHSAVTMPIDVVKTRLQMDGSGGIKQYNGSVDCAKKLVGAEGPSALFKGLPPALVRQSTYGSLRYGLYGPIKDSMGEPPRGRRTSIPLS